ncbi:FkbM family methyltransferase [Anabaena sp. PCC 7108]|uniref:FkbM family methyltransferase n=1 Tax=Anabaena sp. PCC 7108 TaxID=163908 RepID=UPI000346B4E0|nr:FkbM family methyltransferase [Anabaena sp. PCC 7108]
MNILEKFLIKLKFTVWARLKANVYPSFYHSHSQFGEDMVVRFLTNDIKKGFYIDIGAHHPVYYSNTHHFYCKGWQGINIDGAPGIMEIFQALRPRDINLELLLHPEKKLEPVVFYLFDQAAYNTFDQEMADKALSMGVKLVEKKTLTTSTLEEVLDLYLPKGTNIDLMSVDIEGMDEAILMSNNWEIYKPKIIIFEKHDISLKEIENLKIINYLGKYGYEIVGKCGPSLIMKLQTLMS